MKKGKVKNAFKRASANVKAATYGAAAVGAVVGSVIQGDLVNGIAAAKQYGAAAKATRNAARPNKP